MEGKVVLRCRFGPRVRLLLVTSWSAIPIITTSTSKRWAHRKRSCGWRGFSWKGLPLATSATTASSRSIGNFVSCSKSFCLSQQASVLLIRERWGYTYCGRGKRQRGREQEGNSQSDLRRMDMLNNKDNYIIIGTYVNESYEI